MNLPAAETAGDIKETNLLKSAYIIIPQTPFKKGGSKNPHSRDCGALKI